MPNNFPNKIADSRAGDAQAHGTSSCCDGIEDAFEHILAALDANPHTDWQQLLDDRYPHYAEELQSILPALLSLRTVGGTADGIDIPAIHGDLAAAPAVIGDYQIVGEVGRGGMGVVYESIQKSLGRRIALKVLPFASLSDPQHRLRFRNEARAVASVDHPNIVPIHATGEERGVHYLAMHFVNGQSLEQIIRWLAHTHSQRTDNSSAEQGTHAARRPNHAARAVDDSPAKQWSELRCSDSKQFFQRVAAVGAQVADALAHAHHCGVIHRDVKPSNILIDVDGKPWLTDFGLAQLSHESRITRTGDLVGTMRYMSPEQAGGSKAPVDHRTDIYSLGATLYELVALRAAQNAEDRAKLLLDVQSQVPPSLASLCPGVPRPLATIIHKAIEKEATHRFESAAELAADLRRFCDGKRVLAKPPTISQRVQDWARRHRGVVSVAVLGTLFSLATGLYLERQHSKSLAEANHKLDRRYRRSKEDLGSALHAMDSIVMPIVFADADQQQPFSLEKQKAIQDSVELYLDIAHRHRHEPGFMKEASFAYLNVGVILHRLGRQQAAVDAVRHGVAVARERLAIEDNDNARQDLAMALSFLGITARTNATQESGAALAEAERMLESLVSQPNFDSSIQRELLLRTRRSEAVTDRAEYESASPGEARHETTHQ